MKKTKWLKFRHRVITALAAPVIGSYTRLKYHVKIEPFRQQGDRQYLVLFNHQTAFDQFFVGLAFRGPVYYVASEDLFTNGFVSSLLRWAVAPIPIKKQSTDLQAVRNCIRVAREGGTIALAPEGNRTFHGRTTYIKPAIVKLARMLKLPIALFRIEGGYGVHPRWSDVVRRGKMRAYVSEVLEPEQYLTLSEEELQTYIEKALWVDEAKADNSYEHKNLTEYLERAIYVCPSCGLSEFESSGCTITCRRCGLQARMKPTTELEGVGKPFPFRFVADWYDYQCNYVNSMRCDAYLNTPAYEDTMQLSEVIPAKEKRLLQSQVRVRLYSDRLEVGEALTLPFEQTSVITILGKNKLNIYCAGKVYQLKGDARFNALKYMNLFYHYKNATGGNADGQFLGL